MFAQKAQNQIGEHLNTEQLDNYVRVFTARILGGFELEKKYLNDLCVSGAQTKSDGFNLVETGKAKARRVRKVARIVDGRLVPVNEVALDKEGFVNVHASESRNTMSSSTSSLTCLSNEYEVKERYNAGQIKALAYYSTEKGSKRFEDEKHILKRLYAHQIKPVNLALELTEKAGVKKEDIEEWTITRKKKLDSIKKIQTKLRNFFKG